MNKLLVITGPTATGKTKLALELAKEFNGELVSADSRQIYRGMDIGTGKDLHDKKVIDSFIFHSRFHGAIDLLAYDINGIPIWMYDVISLDEEFSISHYKTFAKPIIRRIHEKGKLPILVGGTGLYIKTLLEGIQTIDVPRNEQLRKGLETKSVAELQNILGKHSQETLEQMNNSDRNNPRRLIRKIEIVYSTPGVAPLASPGVERSRYDSLVVCLTLPSEELQKRIEIRVNHRIDQGIIEEIQTLLKKGYSFDLPSLNTFGYKEWKNYIEHPTEENKIKAIADWTRDEIQYAKKQMTWFRKQKNITWFDISRSTFLSDIRENVTVWYNLHT